MSTEPFFRAHELESGGAFGTFRTDELQRFGDAPCFPSGLEMPLSGELVEGKAQNVSEIEFRKRLFEVGLGHDQLIRKAIQVANHSHRDQTRGNGATTMEGHIFPVAMEFINYRVGFQHQPQSEEIAAALVHDVPEDDLSFPIERVKSEFGPIVFAIVAPVIKPPVESFAGDTAEEQALARIVDSLRRLHIAEIPSQELKIIDNIKNMRSIHLLRDQPERVSRKIAESRDRFLGLAAKLRRNLLATGTTLGEAFWLEFKLKSALTVAERWQAREVS